MNNARNLLLVLSVFGLGVLLIVIAAQLATRDPAAWLNAETRSRISADYSADLVRPSFAPLDPRIIAAAAADGGALDAVPAPSATSERVVPANITPVATATSKPGAPTSTPQPGATATNTSATATNTAGSLTPGPGPSQTPAPTLGPGTPSPTPTSTSVTPSSTPTPQPTSTPTPTPTNTPTATQTPTPTATNTPTPTATPGVTVTLVPLSCSVIPDDDNVQNSTVATSIKFENFLSQPVKIFYINTSGAWTFFQTLNPGESWTRSTYVTHPWVVTTMSNVCIEWYQPIAVAGYARID